MKKLLYILSISVLSSNLFAQLDRSKAPEPQPNPEIQIQIPEALSFENGIKVIVVENHKLPVVSFQLFVDYPTPVEGDKAGLSSVFGQMLESGTEKTPKDEFDKKIDYMGADLFTTSRGFYASSLKKHTPALLTLINEMITAPAFTQEDFDRIISQNMSNLAAIPSDANTMSANVSNVVNYGETHPYGEVMTETTLDNITLDDVKAFYQKNFIPNNAYLVIVGDVNKDDAKHYVEDYFVSWKKGNDLKKSDHSVAQAKGNNVYFVNKPGAVQSVISITHNVDLKPGHEDVLKLSVLNQILGGGSFSARLMSNLREDKAYTYGCYSNISSDELIGEFSAGGSFRNEVTDSAIVQILAEIERISNDPVTDKELDLVKKSMTGAFARSLESPQTIARFALNTVRYNLPTNYYSAYLQRLERLTKEDLLLVASEYLTPKNLNIVVVGNEEIADKLKVFDSDGKVTYKNYYGEDEQLMKPVAEGVTAETILNQYTMNILKAKSAEEIDSKLASIGSIENISESFIKEYNTTLVAYTIEGKPNKTASYVMVKSPMGSQVAQQEWFDGESGGRVEMGVTKPYEGEELEAKKKPSFPVSQWYYTKDDSKIVELLGIADVNGEDHYKIKITEKDPEDEFSFEYFNVSSGMLMQKETYTQTEEGETVSVVTTYSAYTDYGLIYLPAVNEINTQGQVIKFETKKVIINKKAKSKAFSGNFKKVKGML